MALTSRLPTSEELYSCGAHAATASFEVGDVDLDRENGLGVDLTLRRGAGRVTGELSLFVNTYRDFIFQRPLLDATGVQVTEDGLPVFRFEQFDAEYRGAELSGLIELHHTADHDLHLELQADWVRAEDTDRDQELDYIPPLRAGLGLQYYGVHWYGGARAGWVDDGDREVISVLDVDGVRTEGYTMVDVSVGYRFVRSHMMHDFLLRGTNVTDQEARVHSSRLRDRVPLPGADVSLVYRFVF
jgi:iron complex outermembrane receptor protein